MHSKQVLRQLNTPPYSGRRELDFTPFAVALAEGDMQRAAQLDDWVLRASVAELRRALDTGQLTCRELALACLRRIQRYASLRAVGELNPDALALADALDAELRAGKPRGELHGIPLLLKDNIATGDRMHNTAGAKALESAGAPRDSFVAARLRAAGALLLGKANLSEWANYMSSQSANGFSVLGGQVRNPYGRFDVSGSSSGSAAALAAGLAPLAVGTETCGSLISPGAANSLAVLKPSRGLVSRDLIIPITSVTDTAGPMARSVADLAPLFQAMTGADPRDPSTAGARPVCGVDCGQFLDRSALQGMRVGWVSNLYVKPADRPLAEQARRVLSACGAALVDLPLRHCVRWIDVEAVLSYGMQHDLNRYLAEVAGYAPLASLEEVIRFNAADLPNRAPFGQDILEGSQALTHTPEQHAALARKVTSAAADELRRLLAEADVLVSLGGALSKYHAIAGFPALTVPLGCRAGGKSQGLTFTAGHFEDGKVIAAAYAFEQAHPARRAPALLYI